MGLRVAMVLAAAMMCASAWAASAAEAVADPLASLSADAAAMLVVDGRPQLQVAETDHGVASTRTLSVGDIYRDGWKVIAIDPGTVTLTRAGETRSIDLKGRTQATHTTAAPAAVGSIAMSNAVVGGSPADPATRASLDAAIARGDVNQVSALHGSPADIAAANFNWLEAFRIDGPSRQENPLPGQTSEGFGVRQINLRNLGTGRTLVLYDGVRLADPAPTPPAATAP